MFKNYARIAFRGLKKNKLNPLINIFGLAIGLATTLLITLFVLHELSFDRWLPGSEQIYKVEFTETEPGHEPLTSAMTPAPVAAALVKDYADIETAVRLLPRAFTVRQGDRQFNEAVYLVDASFFDVFDLPMAVGASEA